MTSIFLSLSYVDVEFVRAVHERLPRGVARYYEKSFDRGEDLITAMEQSLEASEIFVLFATRASLASYAVQFEIEEARRRLIFGKLKKVFVFPIEPDLNYRELPPWMQHSWIPNSGESAADIARYLTTVLLEPDRGLSLAAPNVIGRGATVDVTRRLMADFLRRNKHTPHVYIFPGISGIGRRTFSSYFLRNGLGADANLPYGPTLQLSAQAELIDLYRALRIEIDPRIPPHKIAEDQRIFNDYEQEKKILEIVRTIGHFSRLGQALTISSAAGFFEDAATPKAWVTPLLQAIPPEQTVILISNLQFRSEFIDNLNVAIQQRITELANEDIKTLMTFTADLLDVEDFRISERFISAIGGHPDVANAAVRLAKQKGTAILEKDPSQLFNVQKSIIGESIRPEALSSTDRAILDILSWLPTLGSDILEKIVITELKNSPEAFNKSVENLILGCLIYATGYKFSIAPSVRHLYRRHNVTASATLTAMAKIFSSEWEENEDKAFRDDLFSAFVFMHLLEGRTLPEELRSLMTPSNLYEAVREVYAQGKATENSSIIEQAIEWGKLAFEMNMADSLREEILSTVARAQIRLDRHPDAEQTIAEMRRRGYRQVAFLEGHSLRKRRKFKEAIPKFRFVLAHNRGNRAAVHELAICYRRLRKTEELEALLAEYKGMLDDSPDFVDFQIALEISRRNLDNIPAAIERLRSLDDNSNRADLRHAQYLSRSINDKEAVKYLSEVIDQGTYNPIRLRSARAIYAARSQNLKVAREDLAMIKSMQKNEARTYSIESQILLAEGKGKAAYEIHQKVEPQEPGDWLLRAAIMDALSNSPDTGLAEREELKRSAQTIRSKYRGHDVEFLFDD